MSRRESRGVYRMQERFFREVYRTGEHGWPKAGATPAILRYLKGIRKRGVSGRFLDLGCGEGRHLIAFARAGFRCDGIDIEPLAVREAVAAARKAGVSGRVKVRAGNALRLPYGKDAFDVVLDAGCFHHVKKSDHGTYLRGLLRVLRDGGHYLLTCFDIHFRHTPEEKPHHRGFLVHQGHYHRFFTRGDIRGIFGKDFRILEMENAREGLSSFWHVWMERK